MLIICVDLSSTWTHAALSRPKTQNQQLYNFISVSVSSRTGEITVSNSSDVFIVILCIITVGNVLNC